MKLNLKALGGGFLSVGPLLIQFGVTFTSLGPLLLALTPPEPSKPKRRRRGCSAAKAKGKR